MTIQELYDKLETMMKNGMNPDTRVEIYATDYGRELTGFLINGENNSYDFGPYYRKPSIILYGKD